MSKSFKTSYSIHHQVESFFTGTHIQFDSTGEHFYCAHGSTVNKVCVEDGQVKAQITTKNEDDNIIQFTLTSNNELIIIAYSSGLITKFNLVDDTIEREFKSIHSAPIAYLKTNPSNTHLATGSSDGTIKLWNIKNHYCSHNLKGVNGVVSCIEFHETEEGTRLFCSSGDDNIHVFDLESSQRIAKLSTHCSTITDMKISLDGNHLISVGRDKISVLWNISDRSEKSSFPVVRTIPIYESIESIVILETELITDLFSSTVEGDRVFFASIGEEGLIKIWDAFSGSKVFSQNEPPLSQDRSPGGQCFQLCSRPNHKQLCAVSAERDVFVYDLPKLNLSQQLQGHIDEILSACWFANNRYLAIACNSNDLKVMELDTSKTQHLEGHNDIILCVKSMPRDSFCLATSSKDCSILIWKFDPTTMVPDILFKATGHTHSIHSLAFINDERLFFSAGEDTTLKRWSIIDSKKERKQRNEESSDSTTKPLTASQTIKAHDDRIDDIAVSPNDQLVATGSRDKTAKIFSVNGLQILATLKGHRRGVNSIQFSPVDQIVMTAADTLLRMWNLQDFTCVKTFQGHDCAVLNFVFLSGGLQTLSIGSDGNMKIWDCKTNECMKTIDAHDGSTWALSITEDDSMIVTGGQDEKLIIWRDTTKEEQEERLVNLQTQVVQEQDFMNYINKKKWRKALKMALKLENQSKTLNVVREILLEPNGKEELEDILISRPLHQHNFLIECCVIWSKSAKTSSVSQIVFNIIARRLDNEQLQKISSLTSSLDQFRDLTQKSYDRYNRLVQQAYFVDFFLNTIKLQ